jgi:pimeloyl-ACP methyl ester carboxylesterase
LVGQSYGAIVCLLSAAMCPQLVRSLVVIEPPLYEVAAGDPAVDSLIESQRRVYSRAPRLTASAFVSAWAISRARSEEGVAEWTHSFSAKDWAAADAARKERWPGDAPVDFDVLAGAGFPKVVVAGAWRSEIAPGRQTLARAHRAVCDVIARRIGSQVHVFNDSAHNPQLEEPVRFNELLRTVWAVTS